VSITSDIKSYADSAVATAQASLNDVTGQANELFGKTKENVADIAGKATEAVSDLRTSAEKAINLDALKTAVEPYVAQVKDYTSSVTDRAEGIFAGLAGDPRVLKLVGTAGSVTTVVVATVQERVVKPVQSLTGIGAKAAPVTTPASKPAATKPAATKPAATKTAATKPAATKPAATKTAATKPAATKPAARKAPAARTTTS
jgi:uncharacterized protein YjbJ (UPF0337 family)